MIQKKVSREVFPGRNCQMFLGGVFLLFVRSRLFPVHVVQKSRVTYLLSKKERSVALPRVSVGARPCKHMAPRDNRCADLPLTDRCNAMLAQLCPRNAWTCGPSFSDFFVCDNHCKCDK